jgi:hypothetical protein
MRRSRAHGSVAQIGDGGRRVNKPADREAAPGEVVYEVSRRVMLHVEVYAIPVSVCSGVDSGLLGRKHRHQVRIAEHYDARDAGVGGGEYRDPEGLAAVVGHRGGLTVCGGRDHSPGAG